MATVSIAAGLGNNVLLAAGQSATQTVTITDVSALGNNNAGSKLVVTVNISAFTSGTLTVVVNGLSASGYVSALLTSAALGAAATTALQVSPDLTAVTNLAANAIIPGSVQVVATVSAGGSLTYGIDYCLTP